jgi:hypothetical protein
MIADLYFPSTFMTLSEATGTLKKFRRTAWKFQQTFLTPKQSLPSYVAGIISANEQMKSGCLTIEQAVFEPTHLINLLASYSLPPRSRYGCGLSLSATGQQEVEMLLLAVFSDWIDFIFVPEPKSFAIYADHDEYTTFFAHTRSNLNRVVKALAEGGFKMIPDYERRL